MLLSFAIIGPKNSQNTLDLCSAIENVNHTCVVYNINDISLDSKNMYNDKFFSHDIYLFRGYDKSIIYAHILSVLLLNNKKIVLDNLLFKTIVRNKLEESILLSLKNIQQPQTIYAQSFTKWKVSLKNFSFPIVAKSLSGQKGQDVYKLNSFEDAISFFKKNSKDFLAQEYIKSDGDLRVFIVGNKILGAIKRFTVSGDFRSNASLGAKTEQHNLTDLEKTIALKAHNCMGYDISGVDLILDKQGNPFVLEVNHTPQWQAFKKTSHINPAEEIVNYSIKKYEEKNRIQ